MARRISTQVHEALEDDSLAYVEGLLNEGYDDGSQFRLRAEERFYWIDLAHKDDIVNSVLLSFGDSQKSVLSVVELSSYVWERISEPVLARMAGGIRKFLDVIGVPELSIEVNIAHPITNPAHPKYIAEARLSSYLN